VEEIDDESWGLHTPERSWSVWRMMENSGWRHLPREGGILDQEDSLMEDLLIISWRKGIVKELMKRGPSVPTRDRRNVSGTDS